MRPADATIGIFDSGIGGLTIARAIHDRLPSESFIYYGDTAHMPYGDKSAEAINHYSESITRFLLAQGCKAIVIACNTASAVAVDKVRETAGPDIPVLDVITPVVEHIAARTELRKLGVIATRATINSGIYARKLQEKRPDLEVVSKATPLFAQMVEEGFYNNSVSREVVRAYLKTPELQHIEALIPACTHYPLLQHDLEDFFWYHVDIVNVPELVAATLETLLSEQDLLHSSGKTGDYAFFVSDYTQTFEKIARTFFHEQILLTEKNIWL